MIKSEESKGTPVPECQYPGESFCWCKAGGEGGSSIVVNTQSQSTKLKERLQQWQSYADQSVSVPIEGDPDPGNRGVHDAPPGVFQALSSPQASHIGNRGPEAVVASRYEEHIAELQAELEHEREQAQTLATKLGQEVMGRQAGRQGKTPPRATNPLRDMKQGRIYAKRYRTCASTFRFLLCV